MSNQTPDQNSIEVTGDITYDAYDGEVVIARESTIYAHAGSTVCAKCCSIVVVNNGAHSLATDGSTVTANFGATVFAKSGSLVIAKRGSCVEAFEGSLVYAEDGAQIRAWKGSIVLPLPQEYLHLLNSRCEQNHRVLNFPSPEK